jgi:hypothetical protein
MFANLCRSVPVRWSPGSLPGAALLAAEPTIPVTHFGHARRQQEYSGRNIRAGE